MLTTCVKVWAVLVTINIIHTLLEMLSLSVFLKRRSPDVCVAGYLAGFLSCMDSNSTNLFPSAIYKNRVVQINIFEKYSYRVPEGLRICGSKIPMFIYKYPSPFISQ